MQTSFDIASLLVFGLLAAVYLHRCSKEARDCVPLWAYAVTAVACAVGDEVANHGLPAIGSLCLLGALLSSVWIARTSQPTPKR